MPTEKWLLGSTTTLGTTALNSLANNTQVALDNYNNNRSQAGDGALFARFELMVQFGTAPASGTSILLYLLRSIDGTNFEDGSASILPVRAPDVVFPLRNVNTVQRIIREVPIPPGVFGHLLRNNGTGQPFVASGNSLSITPMYREGA